ncbi:hypothetical protein [Mucilaginibacter lacusdianchii]|uniref:hypothetical protein n=1 Tax=Mucilaginibacter lacusdianchii TaxID=2684211 RepID=UPI00131B1CD7|nr:hypothetical protein [Mucilaginibacter sp. JXJ CY 39]
MDKSATIAFSYKIENILLQPLGPNLRVTESFITRDILDQINDQLKVKNFKVDERTLRPRYIDVQLYLEGFAIEIKEAKTVGFLSGR